MESHAELVTKIRQRLKDAMDNEVFGPEGKEAFQLTMLQILNECEAQKQRCLALSQEFKMKAAMAEGQSHAFSAMGSIIYANLNGLVKKAEDDAEEIKELAEPPKKKRGK